MADRYFDKFPVITYNDNKVVDITNRVALLDRVSRNPYIFYPYDLSDQERAISIILPTECARRISSNASLYASRSSL